MWHDGQAQFWCDIHAMSIACALMTHSLSLSIPLGVHHGAPESGSHVTIDGGALASVVSSWISEVTFVSANSRKMRHAKHCVLVVIKGK